MHSTHLNKRKHQLQRESCSFFHAGEYPPPLPELLCMWHKYIFNCHPVFYSETLIHVILFTWCLLLYFRPVTEKKTPLLRNHSICSGPQRFPFVLIILLCQTSISNGLALGNLWFDWKCPCPVKISMFAGLFFLFCQKSFNIDLLSTLLPTVHT